MQADSVPGKVRKSGMPCGPRRGGFGIAVVTGKDEAGRRDQARRPWGPGIRLETDAERDRDQTFRAGALEAIRRARFRGIDPDITGFRKELRIAVFAKELAINAQTEVEAALVGGEVAYSFGGLFTDPPVDADAAVTDRLGEIGALAVEAAAASDIPAALVAKRHVVDR